MKALILAGGKGTRLLNLHPHVPKALAPVNGQPFLYWQLRWLRDNKVRQVHLALGYRGQLIEDWLANNPPPGLSLSTSTEPQPLGTGGALLFSADHLKCESFLVINGDTLLPNLDIHSLEIVHRESRCLATVAVTRIDDASRFGTVTFSKEGALLSFQEKGTGGPGWVNGGVYCLDHSIMNLIRPGTATSLENELLPQLASERRVAVHPCQPPLLDMGTGEGLATMESHLRSHAFSISGHQGALGSPSAQ